MSNTLFGLPEDVRWCVRCVVSNQRPNSCNEFEHTADSKKATIAFDDQGVCDACRVAELKESIDWAERERELIDLLAQHRSKDGSPDIVVPGSGGKDSVFAAHVLKHKYGMHPLLVTWAPSLFTDWGWRNLVRWQRLGYHQLHTPSSAVNRLLVRLSIDNLFHPFACFTYGQKALAPKVAALHGIRLVMFGEAESEYGNSKAEFDDPRRDARYFTSGDIHLAGISVRDLMADYRLTAADLDPYMPADPEAMEAAGVDVRYLGFYLKWKPQSSYYYAVEHLDFECSPERTPGTWSKYSGIDDKLDDFHFWTTYVKFGIGRATYDAAQEIRSGDIDRDEGVRLVHKFDGEFPERFEAELYEYLSVPGMPPASQEWLLSLSDAFRSPHLWDGRTLRHRVK